jgi:superfamily II DNA or RNA helicase
MGDGQNTPTPPITKELLRELGGWRVDKEGRALAESGRVSSIQFTPPILEGEVRSSGGTTVRARLKFGTGRFEVDNLCSCRQAREQGMMCAHVVALVYAYLNKDTPPTPEQGGKQSPMGDLPKSQPGPGLKRVAREDALPGSQSLELAVLLPLELAKSWKSGEMRIILEGGIQGGPLRPLATVPIQPDAPYVVSDADERLLAAVESCNGGRVPAMWILSAKDFDTFFTALAGHPRVMLGKRSIVAVRSPQHRPKVFLDLQPNGELKMRLAETHARKGEALGAWSFDGAVLERTCPLPAAYQVLAQGEMTLSRTELARFYEQELPALERQAEVICNDAFERLDFSVSSPRIRATLDGVLTGMSVKLEAIHGQNSFALQGSPKPGSDAKRDWIADPKNPFRFVTRDTKSEDRARSEVIAAGFEPNQRWPELYTLNSENRAGFFLANILPRWREKWDIVFGDRIHAFLGKCEIIEPEVAIRSSGNDWLSLDVSFKNDRGAAALTTAAVQQLLQKGVSHQKLASGRIALVPTESVQEFQDVIFDCQAEQTEAGMKISRRFGSYLSEALQESRWKIAPRSNWQPPARVTEMQEVKLPAGLGELLRSYQRTGVNWLHHLAENGMAGILADEMGLGKTVQALAYLVARPRQNPSLIICPTSLVMNWQAESARFTPSLKTLVLHGPKRQSLFPEIARHDLVITSYALLRRDIESYAKREFDTVILDEAQHIKNRFSQNAQAAKSLRAERRFVLTGTPMENSLYDLWSVFDFLMPGYLGPAAEFKERYETPIAKLGDESALRRLRQRLRPFVLRRTKAEVARDLPAKIEQVSLCEMSEEQKSVYHAILEQGRREVFEHAGKGGEAQQRMAVLTTLTRLRQACCHLDLLPRVDEKRWTEPSAKLAMCMELIEEAISGNHRVLVFSQFVKLLRLVQTALGQQEISYCYLDGSTVDRAAEVKRFQESANIPVFLVSLKAGGTGLNLTGADTVIHFDPWWNPAVEDQATARAHRIGQANIVTSYKLIAQGSVEEKIVRLQEKKKELIASALTSDEAFAQNLTWEELQGLLE